MTLALQCLMLTAQSCIMRCQSSPVNTRTIVLNEFVVFLKLTKLYIQGFTELYNKQDDHT